MLGSVIGGYRLIAPLGCGGMGEVYLGVHEATNEPAAIKTLLPEHANNPVLVARFFAEAVAASMIEHPGLARVMSHSHSRGKQAYIIMEYLQGESLSERLFERGYLPIAAAVEIARQATEALAAAHDCGIIHRDIKPANIYLCDRDDGADEVKLLDFGVAKLMDAPLNGECATPAGSVLGTPSYMSPEQCRGQIDVDHSTDLYALGCVLFAMLCGRPPFVGRRLGSLLTAHLSQTPPALRALRPGIPAAVEQVVTRLLSKPREQRYDSAHELALALAAIPTDELAAADEAESLDLEPRFSCRRAPSSPWDSMDRRSSDTLPALSTASALRLLCALAE
ncbi:serine/threonine-protein kinase [Haliangium sp.]|uniref:serine/threonine-protein kinase n=1 Tax=Haliangium sp. TaxID=2663208 RepID=UPI003D0F5432